MRRGLRWARSGVRVGRGRGSVGVFGADPPPGNPIKRGIVPEGELGGDGGADEVLSPEGS